MVTLRAWPPPELPEQPYPVLLPYSHPAFLAGRDGEISELWRLLEMPVPILGLSAPSGTGKSSLLMGGLVPLLREAGVPVAVVRHATEAGIASRLIGDLLDGTDLPADDDAPAFVERLLEVERLAGVVNRHHPDPLRGHDPGETRLRRARHRPRRFAGYTPSPDPVRGGPRDLATRAHGRASARLPRLQIDRHLALRERM